MQFQKLHNICSLVHVNAVTKQKCNKTNILVEYFKSKDYHPRHKYIVYFSNYYFNIFERIKRGLSLKGKYNGYDNQTVYIYFIKITDNIKNSL